MIKKLLLRLLLLAFIAMLGSPLFLKHGNGLPIMTINELLNFDIDIIKDRYSVAINRVRYMLSSELELDIIEPSAPSQKIIKLYKWQDKKGEWHFSDTQDDSLQQEEVEINSNRNVMHFDDLEEIKQESAAKE